jgi:hypothetical protein
MKTEVAMPPFFLADVGEAEARVEKALTVHDARAVLEAATPCGTSQYWVYYRIYRKNRSIVLADTAQKRAIRNYRSRLSKRGMARFEVLALEADRDLIRSLARRLAEGDSDAARIRAAVRQTVTSEPPGKGGILAALRRSPLVGTELDLTRSRETGRKVDL